MAKFYSIFREEKKEKLEILKIKNNIKIIIDNREKNSLVASELNYLGCTTEFKHIEVGDYLIGNVVIERKTVSDFISSMLNKRLLNQLENLKEFNEKLIIIEGIEEQDLLNEESKLNPNAIRGFILSISLKYKVPIIQTKNYQDTAKYLCLLAKRQEKETSFFAKRKSSNIKEQMQYIIESFPGIGPKTAKKLLKEYKTIKNILNTPQEDLEKLIGKKAEIFKLVDKTY